MSPKIFGSLLVPGSSPHGNLVSADTKLACKLFTRSPQQQVAHYIAPKKSRLASTVVSLQSIFKSMGLGELRAPKWVPFIVAPFFSTSPTISQPAP